MATSTPSIVHGVDFVAIPTQDFDASLAFYRDVVGLQESKRWGTMPAGEVKAGDLTIALMQSDAFRMEFRPNAAPIALRVDDVDAARAALEGRGVTFMTQFDSGVCHQAIFSDPDGNPLILHHRYAPES